MHLVVCLAQNFQLEMSFHTQKNCCQTIKLTKYDQNIKGELTRFFIKQLHYLSKINRILLSISD